MPASRNERSGHGSPKTQIPTRRGPRVRSEAHPPDGLGVGRSFTKIGQVIGPMSMELWRVRRNQQPVDLEHFMEVVVLRQILSGPEHLVQTIVERVIIGKGVL